MAKSFRENMIFILVAHACFLAEPAIVHAENSNYQPQNFTQPLNAGRGSIIPVGDGAIYLNATDRCNLVVNEFGWDDSQCASLDAMIFGLTPEIDNFTVEKPVSDGYVDLSDWEGSNLAENIQSIESDYKRAIVAQSKRLRQTIRFDGWLVYPHVDKKKKVLYYANILNWGGNRTINISVSLFDRNGYVPIKIVPVDTEISSDAVHQLVDTATSAYLPKVGASYAEFVSGDKVAGYGALGVLATMLGVKYGKAASAGLIAIGLIFLKKLWFLIFLPFLALGKLFKRKNS